MTSEQWNAIGSVATAAALIYVFIKDYFTRKEIKDLKVLATELVEANKIAAKANKHLRKQNVLVKMQMKMNMSPELEAHGITIDENNLLTFYVKNLGERLRVSYKKDTLENSTEWTVPFSKRTWRHNESMKFIGQLKPDRSPPEYHVRFKAKDIYGNPYRIVILGIGLKIRINMGSTVTMS